MRIIRRRQRPTDGITTSRIEAFSDGVFAIAITLLILEIRIPEITDHSSARLSGLLLDLWPSYFAFVLSFLTIGIYWANHHYIFQLYLRTDHAFNLLNVLFLMAISFLPFPTAILARNVMHDAWRRDAIAFYAFGLCLPAVVWLAMWLYASHRSFLIDERLDAAFVKMLTRQFVVSVVVYLLAFGLTLLDYRVGILVAVAITTYYLLPPPTPQYREGATSKLAG